MTEDTKYWWASKTIWVQVVAFIFAIGAQFEWWPTDITQEDVILTIMAAVTVVTFLLRLRTTEAIKPKGVVAPLVKK